MTTVQFGISHECEGLDPSKSRHLPSEISVSVIVLNVLGVGLLMVNQNASLIVRTLAEGKAILTEGSQAAETFSTPPVATHLRFYFFDLQNLDEVREGKKPVVVEKGPYTYRQVERMLRTNKK